MARHRTSTSTPRVTSSMAFETTPAANRTREKSVECRRYIAQRTHRHRHLRRAAGKYTLVERSCTDDALDRVMDSHGVPKPHERRLTLEKSKYTHVNLYLDTQHTALNPQPSTLNPQPSTLSPQPSTLNPQSPTLNPQPWTPDPVPWTLDPGHWTTKVPAAYTPSRRHRELRCRIRTDITGAHRQKLLRFTSGKRCCSIITRQLLEVEVHIHRLRNDS